MNCEIFTSWSDVDCQLSSTNLVVLRTTILSKLYQNFIKILSKCYQNYIILYRKMISKLIPFKIWSDADCQFPPTNDDDYKGKISKTKSGIECQVFHLHPIAKRFFTWISILVLVFMGPRCPCDPIYGSNPLSLTPWASTHWHGVWFMGLPTRTWCF